MNVPAMFDERVQRHIRARIVGILDDEQFWRGGIPAEDTALQIRDQFTSNQAGAIEYKLYRIAQMMAKKLESQYKSS
jgi:hypothetical protein